MAIKPETMSDNAKLAMAQAATAHITDVAKRQVAIEDTLVRAWAVEQAVKSCGDAGGVVWTSEQPRLAAAGMEAPYLKSAVVPIAREIHQFVTENLKLPP